jgi:hypothetical protein
MGSLSSDLYGENITTISPQATFTQKALATVEAASFNWPAIDTTRKTAEWNTTTAGARAHTFPSFDVSNENPAYSVSPAPSPPTPPNEGMDPGESDFWIHRWAAVTKTHLVRISNLDIEVIEAEAEEYKKSLKTGIARSYIFRAFWTISYWLKRRIPDLRTRKDERIYSLR